jgi:MFS family permease
MPDAATSQWAPEERPSMPGSAATPAHLPGVRMLYGLVGALVGLTGGLGNAMVSVNLPVLQGSLGFTPVEAGWLSSAYVMAGACASAVLFKVRQQYGLRLFAEIGLGLFVLLMAGNLIATNFPAAIALRLNAGFVGSALSSLGTLYMIQAFPAAHRLKALAIGLGLSSFGIPLARIFSPALIEVGLWRGIYAFELGLALLSLGAVVLLKLPPSDRVRVFERTDFVTLAFLMPGMGLACAVLGLGKIVWWIEAPWIGYALIGAIVLLTAAVLIELHRANPLLHLQWMHAPDMIRLGLVSVLIRIVLSEQTYGVVGLLQTVGVTQEALIGLYVVIILAMIAGGAASALTISAGQLALPVMSALAFMAAGAFIEANSSNLTRPEQVYLSQALMAFGASLFMAPAMLFGIARVMMAGNPQLMVSFVMVFSGAQSIGGLAGSAIMGTMQVAREKFHSHEIVAAVSQINPIHAGRLQALAGAYARVQTDPALRGAQGAALLSQQATREANVLAFNDVSMALGVIAALTLVWISVRYIRGRLRGPGPAPTASRAGP